MKNDQNIGRSLKALAQNQTRNEHYIFMSIFAILSVIDMLEIIGNDSLRIC